MRTNIVLDNDLVEEALTLTGAKTKSELVRLAIVELIRSRKRENLLDLAGQIQLGDEVQESLREAQQIDDMELIKHSVKKHKKLLLKLAK